MKILHGVAFRGRGKSKRIEKTYGQSRVNFVLLNPPSFLVFIHPAQVRRGQAESATSKLKRRVRVSIVILRREKSRFP